MSSDGSHRKVIVTGCRHPDGIVVDVEAGHIYWTDMGVPNLNDGSIERAALFFKLAVVRIARDRPSRRLAGPPCLVSPMPASPHAAAWLARAGRQSWASAIVVRLRVLTLNRCDNASLSTPRDA
jgi:hypothetical protein